MFEARHAEAWGHSVSRLLKALGEDVPETLVGAAAQLNQYYIPARCPNGFDQGAPLEYYSNAQAQQGIAHAERIIEYCEGQVSGPGPGHRGP